MTQIGFVTIVEHAPAVIDAYPRESHQLSEVDLADCGMIRRGVEMGTNLFVRRSTRGIDRTQLGRRPMWADSPAALGPVLGIGRADHLP